MWPSVLIVQNSSTILNHNIINNDTNKIILCAFNPLFTTINSINFSTHARTTNITTITIKIVNSIY